MSAAARSKILVTETLPKEQVGRKKRWKSACVNDIKKYHVAKLQKDSIGKQDSNRALDQENHPSPQVTLRWALVRRDPSYQNQEVRKCSFYPLKGMIVHHVLRKIVHDVFPALSMELPESIHLATLCYALNWHAYRETISYLQQLRLIYPQVLVYDESLVQKTMQDVQNVMDHILSKIEGNLTRGASVKEALLDYAGIQLEQDHVVLYRGVRIYFQPDWLRVTPQVIYVLDFKAGGLQEGEVVNPADRIQATIYAWCLAREFHVPVTLAIYYTQSDELWEVPFTSALQREARQLVDEFITARFYGAHPNVLTKNRQKRQVPINLNPIFPEEEPTEEDATDIT